jgi:hypothetical protein
MLPQALKVRPNFTAAGLGGALAVILVWVLSLFNLSPPPEVAAAFATAFSALTVETSAVVRKNGTK